MTDERQRYERLYRSLIVDDKPLDCRLLLKRAADLWPDKCAVTCQEQELDFANFLTIRYVLGMHCANAE